MSARPLHGSEICETSHSVGCNTEAYCNGGGRWSRRISLAPLPLSRHGREGGHPSEPAILRERQSKVQTVSNLYLPAVHSCMLAWVAAFAAMTGFGGALVALPASPQCHPRAWPEDPWRATRQSLTCGETITRRRDERTRMSTSRRHGQPAEPWVLGTSPRMTGVGVWTVGCNSEAYCTDRAMSTRARPA